MDGNPAREAVDDAGSVILRVPQLLAQGSKIAALDRMAEHARERLADLHNLRSIVHIGNAADAIQRVIDLNCQVKCNTPQRSTQQGKPSEEFCGGGY